LPGFNKYVYSGMNVTDIHAVGRPYGRIVILLGSNKFNSFVDLRCSINNRAQCLFFKFCDKKILLFNVYFPCVGFKDYIADVEIITAFMVEIVCNRTDQDTVIILAGDYNAELNMINS
jgi:hypothetical protein